MSAERKSKGSARALPFRVALIGEGAGRITIITATRRDWQPLGGARGAVEAGAVEEFDALLGSMSGDEFAERYGLSRSVVHRLREARGLTSEYTGESKATLWRRGKAHGDHS